MFKSDITWISGLCLVVSQHVCLNLFCIYPVLYVTCETGQFWMLWWLCYSVWERRDFLLTWT